jgi:hypothetical protein
VLAAIADGTSLTTAMVVGGIACALAAPLYIPAWRAERRRGGESDAVVGVEEVSDSAA